MKIVILAHKLNGGGIQAVVREQAKVMLENGFDVEVICNKEQVESTGSYSVFNIPFHTKVGKKQLQKHIGNIDQPLKIIGHSFDSYRAMNNLKGFKDSCYYYVHVDYYAMYYRWFTPFKNLERTINFRIIFNKKNLICSSKGALNSLLKKIKVKPKSCSVIYPPIDLKNIKKLSEERVPSDLPEDFYIVVTRLVERKNVALAIKALSQAKKQTSLLIVGDGSEMPNLKALVNRLGMKDQVLFIGWRDNPYPLIKKAKAFLFSSNNEGFGITIVESLYLGTPVIATDAPSGPKEILGDKYSDMLVRVGDVKGYVNAINRLNDVVIQERFLYKNLSCHVVRFDSKISFKNIMGLIK